ncbi:FAD-dependent oxidoreductase [Lachnospiraceae bacterium MD335]|nr:FAD-dependent oxidoreductase [Lachnospiraceae bacterium MD335]
MIAVNQLKTEIRFEDDRAVAMDTELLQKRAAKLLGVEAAQIRETVLLKHSIDARKKPQLFHVYTLGICLRDKRQEEKIVKRCRNANITMYVQKPYVFPKSGATPLQEPPVIIGTGPAGLFCGYLLAKHGYRPVLLERGDDVDTRTKAVEAFWNGARLDTESNVQFGEGGAGTFSDGKLNTLVKDKNGRNREVLRIFAECGAPRDILYESKPHIGTDILRNVVVNMRKFIIEHGGSVRFRAKVTGLEIQNGVLAGIKINDTDVIKTGNAVLAIGHSARDTFAYLERIGVSMEAKAFAVGMRVEHPQELINACMYGAEHGSALPAASYKLTAQTSTGRGVYSFCMCPGGYVVNASSEEGRLAINGMSYSDRGSRNANSAIIVQVTPDDYGSNGPLAGVAFQRRLEERAYALGKGKIPVQYYGDYVTNAVSCGKDNSLKPCIKGEYMFSNLRGLLPKPCEEAFMEGMEQFDRTIKGYARGDAVLSGIESRTSSPVRIHRDADLQSPSVRGLYPCGEGAGYAGGITSAAMDGILVAEMIAKLYQPFADNNTAK